MLCQHSLEHVISGKENSTDNHLLTMKIFLICFSCHGNL